MKFKGKKLRLLKRWERVVKLANKLVSLRTPIVNELSDEMSDLESHLYIELYDKIAKAVDIAVSLQTQQAKEIEASDGTK